MQKLTRGTSIIEVVIAAALISIAVIASLSLSNHTQKQNTYARGLAEATRYTSEASDWLRTERNQLGWATIAAKIESDGGNPSYCLNALPAALEQTDFTDLVPGSCGDTDFIFSTIFQRELVADISAQGEGVLQFTIIVYWMEKIEREASLEMELTKW